MAILILDGGTSAARVGSGDGGHLTRCFRLHWQVVVGRVTRFILLLAACALTSGAAGTPTRPAAGEYEVKAAFLYNFTKFVEWPAERFADANAPLILGIVGEDPFGSILDDMVKSKTVNGRALTVKRLNWDQDLKVCHILFISASEKKRLPQIIEQLKGSFVLTVGEVERFTQQGGIINFIIEDSKVRFEINVDIAKRSHLKISSKLLMLAKIVRDEPHAERK